MVCCPYSICNLKRKHYLVTPKAGQNSVELDLYPDKVIRLTWRAPYIVFCKGPIRWELIAGPNAAYGPAGR